MAWVFVIQARTEPAGNIRPASSFAVFFSLIPSTTSHHREFLKGSIKKPWPISAQRNHGQRANETLDKAQTTANNAYLKTNKIHEGVMNYNSVVRLTLSGIWNEYPLTDSFEPIKKLSFF